MTDSTQFNTSIWQENYFAPNVESWVFRWWNRVGQKCVSTLNESSNQNTYHQALLKQYDVILKQY